MLSFVTSQAIPLSHARQERDQPAETPRVYIASLPYKGKLIFATAFDALVQSRMRKAKYEIEAHHRMYPDGINK